MKTIGFMLLIAVMMTACSSSKPNRVDAASNDVVKKDTIRIANDSLAYEIIIIEPGFDAWLATAKPRNFYSLTYLENKNQRFVTEWNQRVLQPYRYNPNLYEMRIDYERHIRYGLEVNYLLYNYFIYFQSRYKQRL